MNRSGPSFWQRPVPVLVGVSLLLCLFVVPALQLGREYDRKTGLTGVLFFGREFVPRAIAPVRTQPLRTSSRYGYDGQFYAQLACDPGLLDPGLAGALDRPAYRARRIFVPWLCWLAGGGEPGRILQACALINLLFLALLILLLYRLLRPQVVAEWLCLVAGAWTTGVLVSIQRGLLDLPAVVLLLAAVGFTALRGYLFFAAAVLTRETCWLGILPLFGRGRPWALLIPLGLFLGWCLWVVAVLPLAGGGLGSDFGLPLVAHANRVMEVASGGISIHSIFEILAPLSLFVQVAYFALNRNYHEPFWLLGAPFAVLYLVLGDAVMAEQMAFCRAVLPLTMAFNLLLARTGKQFSCTWFCTGNLGLAWAMGCMVV